jgi:tRNA-splicing ligase RtcB (3'-phosphate/5'-hydroxy nucleic acid ligase)
VVCRGDCGCGGGAGVGADEAAIRAVVAGHAPPPDPDPVALRARGSLLCTLNIRAEEIGDADNIAMVAKHMADLMRVPTLTAGTVMPDACPSGSAPGTIQVGGVVAAKEAIHPGMHSADICCSMAVSVLGDLDPTTVLDAGMKLSHFGGGGRPYSHDLRPPDSLMAEFADNKFLALTTEAAKQHFATQGDGNHFFFVGRLASTGQVALVTHHGSRKPGALLYKASMEVAERYRQRLSPETPAHNAWIPSETEDGRSYWDALQLIRTWTKKNHFAIHDVVAGHLGAKVKDRFWNEHNFVFRKSDGLYYHAKGATPAWADFAADSSGLTLIPLNMAEPILIARGANAEHGLGFAPHGAGRNFSRSAYMRRHAGKTEAQMVAEQTKGIDARFFCGNPDVSELPGAYKSSASVRRQIAEFGLAQIVDTIEPVGSIMAGDWQRDAPWRRQKAAKKSATR